MRKDGDRKECIMGKEVISTCGLKFRWINGQGFEFRMPNGKTLLTDPFFYMPEFQEGKGMSLMGFHVDDIEQVDYVFVNHTHHDHIGNLQQVVDRFHPIVICHSAVAMELARNFCIPLTSIYPVDFNGRYYFDGFSLDTYHGTHHASKADYETSRKFMGGDDELGVMGSIFNVNFILNLPEGLRVAFVGGNDDGMTERFREIRPNIMIRNKMGSSRDFDRVAERFADIFVKSNTQLLIPMHCETWANERPEFLQEVMDDMNRIMEEHNLVGRVKLLERTKWYSLNLTISELD